MVLESNYDYDSIYFSSSRYSCNNNNLASLFGLYQISHLLLKTYIYPISYLLFNTSPLLLRFSVFQFSRKRGQPLIQLHLHFPAFLFSNFPEMVPTRTYSTDSVRFTLSSFSVSLFSREDSYSSSGWYRQLYRFSGRLLTASLSRWFMRFRGLSINSEIMSLSPYIACANYDEL